jgi:hypothetical protein
VLRRPSRGLPQWIDKWFRTSTMRILDLRGIGTRLEDPKVATKLDALADDLELVIAAAERGTTRSLLRVVKEQVGLGQAMSLLDASSSASHLDDLEALEQVADLHPDPAGFEPWLRQVLAAPVDPAGVTLATIHKVKGREWPHVVLFGVSDGIVPHRLSNDLEEERRVLHVGITRGHRHVAVLTDSTRPSPFLGELDGTASKTRVRVERTSTATTAPTATAATRRAASGAAKPAPKDPVVDAVVGAGVQLNGGFDGTITEVAADSVLVTLTNGSAMRVRLGERVTAGGVRGVLRTPADPAVLERLRAWRRDRAKADGVPPYVVLHDKHLEGLAAARPTSMTALAKVDGMGPRRLELYGDDLLALLGA